MSGGPAGCKVCSDPIFKRVVDEELAKGISFTGLSRMMTMRGFPVTAGTLSRHKDHQAEYQGFNPETAEFDVPSPKPQPRIPKRDASIYIKNRLLDALEGVQDGEPGRWEDVDGERVYFPPSPGILSKDLQPALNTALKAQAIEDKREAKKPVVQFWVQLFTSQQEEPLLLDDPAVIEGAYTEVSDG